MVDIIDLLLTGLLLEAMSILPLLITLKLARNPIRRAVRAYIVPEIDLFLGQTLENIEKHPEILKPVAMAFMKALDVTPPGQGGEAMIKLPFIGKVPLSLISQFLPGLLKGGVNVAQGKNPLD